MIDYSPYIERFEKEGIDQVCEAFAKQQEITKEMQDKEMFSGEWEGFVGALELSAYTAIVAYKDGLAKAMRYMVKEGVNVNKGGLNDIVEDIADSGA